MRPATFSSARAACAPRAPCVRRSPQTMTTSSPASRSRSATALTSCAVEPAACASSSSTPPPPSAALRAATNASPAPGAKRATAPALGSSDEGRLDATASLTPLRRTPLRMRRSTIGMSSTGSQSRTRTACANSMSGIVACTDGLPSAACRPAGRRPEARESRCGESSALAHEALEEEALLVRRAVARQRADAAAHAAQGAGGGLEGALPAHRRQLAAVAQQRLGDALVDVDGLVREAPAVAEPPVVDLVVLAGEDAQDALVADGELDVALARAERADRARALDVPRARAEAVRLRRQRADGAELDDVAAERGDVGVPVERRDVRVGAALLEDELVVLGDLLAEAHAAVAEDAALAVDRDERREPERLLEVALGLDEARAAAAPAEGDVLQRALAALVADRAVERVVDEEELDDGLLRLLHAVGLRVDDHPVLDRRGAAGLQLRDALDLDEAHAAGADGRAELGLVTEDRDLDVAVLGGVDQHRVDRGLHLAAVDRERDELWVRAGHSCVARRLRPGPGRARRRARRLRRGCGCARPRCTPRTRRGTWRPSSRSASPSRRRGRRGSCR